MAGRVADQTEVAPTPQSPHAVSRRSVALGASALLLVAIAAVAALLPVPYVREAPGPTSNTLGTDGGKALISISGRRTYPTAGHLDLLTVSVSGGPGNRLDLFSALEGWLDKSVAVVPEEAVYPKGKTGKQIQQENAEEMSFSQQNATAAALQELKIPVRRSVVVKSIAVGSPSLGVLRAADVITAIDGTPVADSEAVRTAITRHRPGQQVVLSVTRDKKPLTLSVTTRASDDGGTPRAVIGISPDLAYVFPFDVNFSIDRVGGPSAGQMFALGIIDKLTPGALTGGKFVAGTGTIDPDGTVGAIGGIAQKMVAADRKHADLFLAPAANCADVRRARPDGLHVVKVATLADSLKALAALRAGTVDALPTCG